MLTIPLGFVLVTTLATVPAPEPAQGVETPRLDEELAERVVVRSEAYVRRGPDHRTPVSWIVTSGTPAAASSKVVAGFRRVRLPGGATGWTEANNLKGGPAAAQAWSDPGRSMAPRPPPTAHGEPWFGPPTLLGGAQPRRHDGVFARATGAVGLLEDGGATSFTLAAGTAVLEDMVVGVEGWLSSTVGTVPVQDEVSDLPGADVAMRADLRLLGIGPTLVIWTGRANVSLSVTPALVWLDIQMADATFPPVETTMGLGFRIAIAKEWWVSDGAAVGVIAWVSGTTNPMKSSATGFQETSVDSFTTLSGGAGVTWTFN